MIAALDRYFPPDFSWSRPDGGMFVWARGPQGLDATELYKRAVARKVAFVPGRYFYAEPGRGLETMRLNYTMMDEQRLDRAIATLAEVLTE